LLGTKLVFFLNRRINGRIVRKEGYQNMLGLNSDRIAKEYLHYVSME